MARLEVLVEADDGPRVPEAVIAASSHGHSHEVLARTIALLERLSVAQAPIGVSALARMTSIPKTTAYRLLENLAEENLLSRQAGGYVIGSRLRGLARLLHDQLSDDLREVLRPYLVELYERTDDMASLGVLDQAETVIVEAVCGLRHTHLPRPSGRMPAHCTAIGKLLMALRPNSLTVPPTPQVELEACTRHSIVDRQKLVAELDRIRRHGVAISNQEQFLGIIDVALPVVGLHGPVAAIARSYPIQSPVDSSALAIHREIAFAASAAVRRCQTSH